MWLMRQAGRYLPEYRALRATKGGFLDLAYDPEAAAEITLQPLRRFAFDGAILFSDILVVPHAMGMDLSFVAGEGPRLAPPLAEAAPRPQTGDGAARPNLRDGAAGEGEIVARDGPLGFAGSPWTVATYMIAGQGSREQAEARQLAYADPGAMDAILDGRANHGRLSVAADRSRGRCGAIVRQLVGKPVSGPVRAFGHRPHRLDRRPARATHPDTPIIGFPKGAAASLGAYAAETGVDAIELDETVDPAWAEPGAARRPTGPGQSRSAGADRRAAGPLKSAVGVSLTRFADRPHIFNLGHGIQQTTPIAMSSSWLRW